jgi:hypothetical protein
MTSVRGARLLAVVVSVPLLLSACSDDAEPASNAGATRSVDPSAPAGPPPPVETATPSAAATTLPPREIGQTADLAQGIVVSVVSVRERSLKASGPGEVAGPGVVVRLEVRNATAKDFDLTTLAVNATYGDDATPAPPGAAADAPGLSGTLKAGAETTGTYAFKVPADQAKSVEVDVTSSVSPNIVVFRR